jgi:hypothetical protein
MFTDPQSITVSGSAKSMPRVETSGRKSIYQKSDGLFTLTISHHPSKGGSRKAIARFDQKVNATDPFDASRVVSQTLGISVMFDIPAFGFDATALDVQWTGFKTWLDSTASGKLFGSES